mmetsp:Transcript_27780/g.39442  ORF Transcript_27780/g.39442 Transcript_27780/m.39442 type:complete len:317 (+) Transcript_27780:161-1111(+)|eukprot:CAMPEP_0170057704 /NCGR_PEP_ID=MMETSP0019_2-20121128/600_1 /TAXON_ID=98059 /ORGANISM="Dinobryon sp., Strain UTEXLB2267" /LENGTH=316 /DNA_ID=CAMNT_0010262457 /DNA_START=30 /DNA_END=980 /DNA_ORIENTATION=-
MFENSPYILLLSISVFVNVLFYTSNFSFVSIPKEEAVSVLRSSTVALEENHTRRLADSTKLTAVGPGENKKMETMRVIGGRTHTDKIYQHRYDRYYPRYLRHLRNKQFKMFEIGFLFGESYEMWRAYFPRASIYFMDKGFDPNYWETVKKRPDIVAQSFVGDQSKVSDLQKALTDKNLAGDLDFIIDDGSHYPDHQLITFKFFFEKGLKPGGIYIIEDIEQNYWYQGDSYGYSHSFGKDHPKSVITVFKAMADVVNREFGNPKKPFKSGLGPEVDKWVSSVTFGHNCIIITKMDDEEFGFAHRSYRFADNTTPKTA